MFCRTFQGKVSGIRLQVSGLGIVTYPPFAGASAETTPEFTEVFDGLQRAADTTEACSLMPVA
jgi:hypothetical protein